MMTPSRVIGFFHLFLLFTACNGQSSKEERKSDLIAKGDSVTDLGKSIMVVYQDKKNNYWFGSWETGVYKYDGKILTHYTSEDGLINNRIDEIKEDHSGNIYFVSANITSALSQFNGHSFTTLTATPSDHWQLQPTDLWFKHSYGNTGKVYRYDGTFLYELTVPHPPSLSNPFDVYSIYQDSRGNLWLGTNPIGVCRYNGKTFEWILEEDVTEFRNEGANGVRSILEDQKGDLWFNTEYRYSIHDSATIASHKFYTRHKSIGGLDGKEDSHLNEYLSSAIDDNGNLWFVTYLDGVWKFDGTTITHYPIHENSQRITLFSIYKDNTGQLWLGTHENGAYLFNGTTFEKFVL